MHAPIKTPFSHAAIDKAFNGTMRTAEGHCEEPRPEVRISNGSLPWSVDQAERVLIEARRDLYQRGSFIIRPAVVKVIASDNREMVAQRLVPVTIPHLVDVLTTVADFRKFNMRANAWLPIDCPKVVAETYLAREGHWNLPVLMGVINAPTLRRDGSILDRPGYDLATGLLFDPQGAAFPKVPLKPTKADAEVALKVLKDLIGTFPFLTDADRSVALSGILTTIIRRSLKTAPLHAFSAPTAGSGKSLLVDICSQIAFGHLAAVISQGQNEEEQEKRLGASLLAGHGLISIDNCEAPLGGELLCQSLSQPQLKVRVLGKSLNVEVSTNVTMFATGNNLEVNGDMTRRTLLCSLDPKCERPELREFDMDPLALISKDRGQYVVAALTMLHAYHVEGRPNPSKPLGSFEEWSTWVRSALVWLGEADPVKTMEKVRASDPQLEQITTVFEQWFLVIGDKPVKVEGMIEAATKLSTASGWNGKTVYLNGEFREALLVVAGDNGAINSRKLGWWLRKRKGRVVAGFRLHGHDENGSAVTWELKPVDR